MKKPFISFIFLVIISLFAHSQNQPGVTGNAPVQNKSVNDKKLNKTAIDDGCKCSEALQHGTDETFTANTGHDLRSSLQIIYSHDYRYWKDDKWKTDQSIQSGGEYAAIFSGFFNYGSDESKQQTIYEEMRSKFLLNSSISENDYSFYAQLIKASKPYDVWVACIKLCVKADAMVPSFTKVGSEVSVTLHWSHVRVRDTERIKGVTLLNAQYIEGNLKVGNYINGGSDLTAKYKILDPKLDVYIKIDVDEYDTPPLLISVSTDDDGSLSNLLPIGTVITSVFDWKRFCQINHLPELINYTNKKCKWVPADGRAVNGSEYGKYDNNVPDLRGVFLRGINDFGVPGVQKVNEIQADPDGTRLPGNLQLGEFKAHTHGYQVFNNGIIQDMSNDKDQRKCSYGSSAGANTSEVGGKETRPVNKAIFYYIKIN